MSLATSFEKLDRRWIFLVTALLVLVPLLWPLNLPLEPSAPVRDYHRAIEALPPGSLVLVSCDFDPASRPELEPMARTTLTHLFRRGCHVVVVCLYQGGARLVDTIVEDVARSRRKVGFGFRTATERVNALTTSERVEVPPGTHVVDRGLALGERVLGRSGFPRVPDVSHLVERPAPEVDAWLAERGVRFDGAS